MYQAPKTFLRCVSSGLLTPGRFSLPQALRASSLGSREPFSRVSPFTTKIGHSLLDNILLKLRKTDKHILILLRFSSRDVAIPHPPPSGAPSPRGKVRDGKRYQL